MFWTVPFNPNYVFEGFEADGKPEHNLSNLSES